LITPITEVEIEGAFRDAIQSDENGEQDAVLVLSRLWTFAHRTDIPPRDLPLRILDIVERVCGPNRTVIYPAFTFSYGRMRHFDLKASLPETGVIPKLAMNRASYERTPCPMVSYLVRGPLENEVLSLPFTTTCGEGSVLHWLAERRARAVAIGMEEQNNGWSLVHVAEEAANVPYRYYKRLAGTFSVDGKPQGTCADIHFVNPLSVNLRHDYSPLNRKLEDLEQLRICDMSSMAMRSVRADHVVSAARGLLASDPYCFIENDGDAHEWVTKVRDDEILKLNENERWP